MSMFRGWFGVGDWDIYRLFLWVPRSFPDQSKNIIAFIPVHAHLHSTHNIYIPNFIIFGNLLHMKWRQDFSERTEQSRSSV